MTDEKKDKSRIERLKAFLNWAIHFITYDIWRITENEVSGLKEIYINAIKTIILAIRGFQSENLQTRASALTYNTLLAIVPLLAVLAQPLGAYSYWIAVVIIGIVAAAHQAWSANIFSTVGDMFPKSAVATVTGIGGMAGGMASFIFNKCSGVLFDYSESSGMAFMGFEGIEAGYFIIFCICSVLYLAGWVIMKLLVPRYKLIEVK